MVSRHVVKISNINEFLNDNNIIKKGENALECDHVKKMQYDDELLMIKGEVLASMKDKLYKIEMTLNKQGNITSANCECPRGIKCHHIAALALFGHYNISVTDKSCTWNAPKSKEVTISTAEELYPPKSYSAIKEKMTKEQKTELKMKLSTLGNTVGYSWLLQEEKRKDLKLKLPSIQDILSANEFINATDKVACFKQNCALDDNSIKEIAILTIGQATNENWYLARKFRLTASNFGSIIAACNRNKFPESLFKTLNGSYNLDGLKSIQWGRTHEKNGLDFLKEHLKLDIKPTGIFLSRSGFLGASPDGLVGNNEIVEIKCPYSFRNDSLTEKLKKTNTYIIKSNDRGEITLNEQHNYFHQIQGNLYLTNREKCYLCIWTPKEIISIEVERDALWAPNIHLLENFYLNRYLPKLLEK